MNRKTFILTLMLLMFAGLSTWAQNVAKIGDTEYATLEAAFSNVKSGQIIYLLSDFDASTTNFTGCNNKNVIIAGRTGTEVLNMGTGHKGGLTGCTITFLNLKMQIRHDPTTGTWYTQGLNHANKIRYDKVTFDGCVATYDDVEFLNCTFTSNPQNMEYTLWNYCGTVVLDKCTFEAESAGTKSFVKQYAEPAGSSATNLAVIDTKFIEPTEKNEKWKGCYIYESTNNNAVNKIYVDSKTTTIADIIKYSDDDCKSKTTICNTLAEFGIEDYWSNFAASTFNSLDETAKTITISTPAELALLAKNVNSGISYAGYTITISSNLDMTDHYWVPINASNSQLSGSTIQGTAAISNLKIEKAVYKDNYDYYAGFIAQTVGTLTVKDLNFSGAVSVDNGSGVATVLGLTYGNVLFDNVKVLNSTVTATTKAGALVGFTGGDGITVTVKNCTLENVTVKAEYSYALMVGLVNTNDHVVFEGKNEAKNSKTELDETKAGEDFPDSNGRKSINGYTYGVDDTKLWVINVKDAWAECRTNPSPTMTIDGVKYTIMGDIFYHADNVIVDVCAVAKIDNKEYRTLASAIAAVKDGETITMIANEVLTKGQTITLENNEQFTLDLNGKTISIAETGFDFTANGTNVALRNGVPARFAIVVNGNGTLNICDNSTEKLGKIETKNYAYSTTKTILVDGNAIVNVNSGTIAADYAPFYVVGFTGVTAVPEDAPKPTLNVNGGKIVGQQIGIGIKGNTATLKVVGGEIVGNEYYGVSTNGTQDWYDGGKFAIEITGGLIKSVNGNAMYLPAEGPTVITGGTIEGTTGIAVKGGSLSISNDAVVKATGPYAEAKEVSSGNANTGSAIYVEDTYSNHSPIVNISGGKFSSVKNKAVEYYTTKAVDAPDKGKITVYAGLYDDDSAKDYLATGKTVIGNPDEAYPYAVVPLANEVQVAPDLEITSVDEESPLTPDQQTAAEKTVNEAITSMADNTEVKTLPEDTQTNNNSAVAENVVGTKQSVGINVEFTGTKVSVETGTGTTTTVTLKELTFDVTPYVVEKVTISEQETSVAVKKIENEQIKAPMTFRLPIPSSVADNCARVIHHKENGEDEDMGLYSITINNGKKYIEISTPSFSQFDIVLKNVSAPTNLSYYAGNSTEKKITDPNAFLNTKATEPNAIAFVGSEHASWAAEQTNVVVDHSVGTNDGHYYECPKFVLTDLEDFYTPVDFHVVNGSYTRENTSNLNTVCLPFKLSSTDVNNGQIGVFHSTDMYDDNGIKASGNVYFNVVENVNPGTPCIIACDENDAGWNIDLAGKTVAANPNNVNALKGSYVEETIGAGVYKVDSNGEKFGKTTYANETVVPFRAYLDLKHDDSGMGASGVKEFNIEWADDATGIENVKVASDSKVIYDLTGRMVNNPVKGGLYIINGKKVIFK